MSMRKILAGAALAGALTFGAGTAAGAADNTSVCTSYWNDTTQITSAEAELEAAAALEGQTVTDYCATITVTDTDTAAKHTGMPDWVADKLAKK
jgi:hypothetical protein